MSQFPHEHQMLTGDLRFARIYDPLPSLEHLRDADRRTLRHIHQVREATISLLPDADSAALSQMAQIADRLLEHIRLYQYLIDNFAGPNSAAMSERADLRLGDFAPGDLVPAPALNGPTHGTPKWTWRWTCSRKRWISTPLARQCCVMKPSIMPINW